MVLTMCMAQRFVHAREIHLVEGNGVRRCERNSTIAFNRIRDDPASRSLDDELMELLVHFAITSFIGCQQMPLSENVITFPLALMQQLYEPTRRSLLGQHARSQSF